MADSHDNESHGCHEVCIGDMAASDWMSVRLQYLGKRVCRAVIFGAQALIYIILACT